MSNKELIECLKEMISIQDPISLTRSERLSSANFEPYLNAEKNELRQAYELVLKECATPFQTDFLDFLVDIQVWMGAYEESGELWDLFGDTKETQMINIEIEYLRKEGAFRIHRFTIPKLIELTGSNMRDFALPWIPKLTPLPRGSMLVHFTDDEKTSLHGFPFDFSFLSVKK